MPLYERRCLACAWATDFSLERWQDRDRPCPDCGAPTDRIWTTSLAIIPDTYTTPLVDDVIDKTTRVFHSRSERRAAMKALGLQEMVRHVGDDAGTDRSRYTKRWI